MKSILTIFLVALNICTAQSDVPLTLRSQFNGSFGYTIIGNTHNSFDNRRLNQPPPCQMQTQSSAILNLQTDQTIVAAYLYWSGIGNGTFDNTIQLNGTSYFATQTVVGFPFINNLTSVYFGSFVDISSQVLNTGNGTYNFSSLNLNPIIPLFCSSATYYSGWHIVVIYNQINLNNQQLNIYDGLNVINNQFNGGTTLLNLNSLNVVSSQNARISYVVWNGSSDSFFNESIKFNGNILSNSLNPVTNPFNSSNSFTNSTTNWNQDIDTFDISPFINIGDTQANIIISSILLRTLQTVITSFRSELPDATVQLNQVSGQTTCGNRNLSVNYTVANTNSNAPLPANVPVSFFANNVFLSTVNTPSGIAIGGSLPLLTTVAIPVGVSDTFNLRVVVNRTASATSTIAESNLNNNEASQSISLLGNTIASVFSVPTVFCQGATVPVLPATSINSVLGSWSPGVINNQSSGSYVFTPTVGTPSSTVCASPFTLNVVITPSLTPAFSIPNTFCQGAAVPVLPTSSTNGVFGSWSPAVINNQISGSYVFTPAAVTGPGPVICAIPFTLNVTITPNIATTFSIPTTFCQGAAVPVLPATSNNSVLGTWLPNVISNQSSGNYVFTPNSGFCGLPFTLNFTITPNVTPTFSVPNTFCVNAIVPALPLVSNNGISGTWSPNAINNQVGGSYIFTPNAGQCALPFTQNVVIQTQNPTTANLVICNDAQGNNIRPVDLDSNLNPNDFVFVWTKEGQILTQNTSSISVATIGNYELSANPNGLNCPQIYRFNVTALTPITATYTVSDDFEINQTVTVNAVGGSGQYQYSFENLPFQSYPIYSVLEGGEILVKTRYTNGCYEISKTITLWQYPRFFTPNGDGFNDTWNIKTQKKITIDVFNRFGKLIQQLKTGDKWNGTFNSQPLPADDYWFVVYNDGNQMFKGHFALKR